MASVLSHLKIGFDLDGVLAHSDAQAVAWFKSHGLVPPETTPADITDYDYPVCFENVTRDHMEEMFRDPAFFRTVEPDYEAVELVRDLVNAGADVHIVTHRDWRHEDREATAQWLSLWGVPYTRLVFRTIHEKKAYADKWELDYFIEDHPKTAVWLAQGAFIRASFLRDKPYNRNTVEHPKLVRFYRWADMRKFFRI